MNIFNEDMVFDLEGALKREQDKLAGVDKKEISNQGKKWMKQTYRAQIKRLKQQIADHKKEKK